MFGCQFVIKSLREWKQEGKNTICRSIEKLKLLLAFFGVKNFLPAISCAKSKTDNLSLSHFSNIPNLLLPSRVLVKVFPVSTVEPAERFTRLTTTNVHAHQTSSAETVRTVSFLTSLRFCYYKINITGLIIMQTKWVFSFRTATK